MAIAAVPGDDDQNCQEWGQESIQNNTLSAPPGPPRAEVIREPLLRGTWIAIPLNGMIVLQLRISTGIIDKSGKICPALLKHLKSPWSLIEIPRGFSGALRDGIFRGGEMTNSQTRTINSLLTGVYTTMPMGPLCIAPTRTYAVRTASGRGCRSRLTLGTLD